MFILLDALTSLIKQPNVYTSVLKYVAQEKLKTGSRSIKNSKCSCNSQYTNPCCLIMCIYNEKTKQQFICFHPESVLLFRMKYIVNIYININIGYKSSWKTLTGEHILIYFPCHIHNSCYDDSTQIINRLSLLLIHWRCYNVLYKI